MKISKKKMLAYAASGGAVLGFAQTADADLTFNSGNIAAGTTVNDSTVAVDLDGDGTIDLSFVHDADGGFNGTSYAVAYASGNGATGSIAGGFYAAAGASSASASSAGSFTNGAGYLWDGAGFGGSNFNAGTTNFLGVQFTISGTVHYGFVEVFISDDPNPAGGGMATSNVITINNYAYQTTAGAAAHFEQPPAIPEPGSLGLLALGACGIGLLRRKRVA